MLSKIKKNKIRNIFLIFGLVSVFYISFVKSSLYESTAVVTIKNLGNEVTPTSLLGLVSGQAQNSTNDAFVIQEYLMSHEVFDKLNEKFGMRSYYNSNELDPLQRLYDLNSYEDYLKLYNKHLNIVYDEVSNITKISFLHVDQRKAKEIVDFIVNEAEEKLNEYNKQTINKQLKYLEQETQKQKKLLDKSIKELEEYQDIKNLLNPKDEAQTNISILSSLKSQLLKREAELKKVSKYLTNKSFEIIDLKRDILELKRTISKIKKEQSGSKKETLNKSIFHYERLKAQVDLYSEIYKQSLLQLQASRVELNKDSKILQVLVKSSVADSYTEPKKIRELITLLLVLFIIYGIFNMMLSIIKDHRD